ncbi:OLC1v1013391C1 [Oldenlandia corymbosa var. corymbosa]|uniref:Non-specific lipid-transfer protein n=1 Tax=Oldenlandia corymbosa var. corymbosa TaxID=529605 RepID=A0AAV1E1U0_OLDCO|nr:OLC1v1013391C1 [Oldenlandia corymbosa var. corymbosa]
MACNSALFIKLFCVGLLGLLILAPHAEAVIQCGTVFQKLGKCLSYISGGALDPACCQGISSLKAQAASKPDRQAVCGCLKQIAAANPAAAAKGTGLLKACKVSIPYALNPKIDCAKVN